MKTLLAKTTPGVQQQVRQELLHRGFSLIRFAAPPLGRAAELFEEWLRLGYDGQMAYLARRKAERLEPKRILPQLKSILILATPYDSGLENTSDPFRGNVSRYAWGEDYHEVLGKRLGDFREWLERKIPGIQCYGSIDAGPVLEKAWAQKAGLGWMGKNTNMIDPEQGSYFFLSTLLTDYPFEPDPPEEDRCGTCDSCLEVCPTGALVAPYVLDAGRCISYLTIELKGFIPREFRPLMGNRIFGCDDCQEVCPWNRFSRPTKEKCFLPRSGVRNQDLEDLLKIGPKEFKQRFQQSPIFRSKWKGFQRNILVAMGNSRSKHFLPLIEAKLLSEEPLIRGHAVWAYARLLGAEAKGRLSEMRETEGDPLVLEEIDAALK